MEIILLNEISLNGKSTHLKMQETYLELNKRIPCDGIYMDESTAYNSVDKIIPEEPQMKSKCKKSLNKQLPYLIISDFKGILTGYLHMFRQKEELRDIIIVTSINAPKEYLEYLEEREYSYFILDENSLDLEKIFEHFKNKFKINKIRVEVNGAFQKKLIQERRAKDLYLLIDAIISTGKIEGFEENLFSDFELLSAEALNKKMILAHYQINKNPL